jgi:Gamma tubulin complex component N-terminal
LKESVTAGESGASKQLPLFLLHRASVPYMDMLSAWIYDGTLHDPYSEFLVRKEEGVKQGDMEVRLCSIYTEYTSVRIEIDVFCNSIVCNSMYTSRCSVLQYALFAL